MLHLHVRAAGLILAATLGASALAASSSLAAAQGAPEDYARAIGLREKYQRAAAGVPDAPTWIDKTDTFWYRRSVPGGQEFLLVDAETRQPRPAFDHEKLAASLSRATGNSYEAATLPTAAVTLTLDPARFEVRLPDGPWRCEIATYACAKVDPPSDGRRRSFDGPPPACEAESGRTLKSPDGRREALISNYNVVVREPGKKALTRLSLDGSEGDCYQFATLAWSPDSARIAAYRTRPGYRRTVHYVESSPEDQLQPKHSSRTYAKPGDIVDFDQPVIFQIEPARQIAIDRALFPTAYDLSRLVWRKDSAHLTFEYNQRGHQVYRIIEADAATGAARAVVSEETKTFFYYNLADGTLTGSGKRFRHDVADGREIIWMSERDGWNHLYLYDGATGTMKNQITKGAWVVRGVQKVDEAARQIWFSAGGVDAGVDPYFAAYFRINFDGSGLTRLTDPGSNHTVTFSSDMKYYTDLRSRVDEAPVLELRKTSDNSRVIEVARGDLTALRQAGWKPPEVFTAAGRDGKTDIWGVIYRPAALDPSRKYPVIEQIYAGPQGSFVPKSFSAYSPMQALAEIGFVVVQIDGMGTSNRSKAFHDVAWKNLKDAGFEDRILWHKAVAAKYPWYDISRVGIYGTSAGGQSSFGALLFHPEFYKAAVSAAGCHDNRMDKMWWNEQWMGYPIGPEYAASSNVDNAYRLQGHVLLVVGEMDPNVDPSSTMQVVNQLIKHNKEFDLLVVPGMGHGSGGAYGDRKRFDFFVRHLLDTTPPVWNTETPKSKSSTAPAQTDSR